MRDSALIWLGRRWSDLRISEKQQQSARHWLDEPRLVCWDDRVWWLGTDGWSFVMLRAEPATSIDPPAKAIVATLSEKRTHAHETAARDIAEWAGSPEWEGRYVGFVGRTGVVLGMPVDRCKIARVMEASDPGDSVVLSTTDHPEHGAIIITGSDWMAGVMAVLQPYPDSPVFP